MILKMELHVRGLRDVVALCDALKTLRNVVGQKRGRRGIELVRAYFAGSGDGNIQHISDCARAVYMLASAVKEGKLVEDDK